LAADTRPVLYIRDSASLAPLWRDAAQNGLPQFDVQIGRSNLDLDRVTAALVWKPAPGFLASLPNLKLVVSVGAGVDHIVMSDPDFPRHVPLVRMVDPGLTQGMIDFVVWACLSILRKAKFFANEQLAKRWEAKPIETSPNKTIAVLGLGQIGLPVARMLKKLGFQVIGWSRRYKKVEDLHLVHGSDELKALVGRADMVVNLLPSTRDTYQIMGTEFFSSMKKGAAIINAGRGATVDENALLEALSSGQLSEAYLDVFQVEPLPSEHAFWIHPKITITPHIAAITHPKSGIRALKRALAEIEANKPLSNLVDWNAGY